MVENMRFKYEKQIRELPNCPPINFNSGKLVAFRFIFEKIDHKNNFCPVLQINPGRRLSDNKKCSGYGLSLYDSLEHAKIKYQKLSKRIPNFYKTVGTHIAEGIITKDDGVVSTINKQGHFTLHEFEYADLRKNFSLIAVVYDGKN